MPRCYRLFLAGIVDTPLKKITKQPIWRATKYDPSGVKKKRVVKDFSAEEVIRLMEGGEFSAWYDKNLLDDSFDEDDESQRGCAHVVDKISYLQLIHNFLLC